MRPKNDHEHFDFIDDFLETMRRECMKKQIEGREQKREKLSDTFSVRLPQEVLDKIAKEKPWGVSKNKYIVYLVCKGLGMDVTKFDE